MQSEKAVSIKVLMRALSIIAMIGLALTAHADVKIDSFEEGDYAPQNDPVACWAASMSAALKVKGVDLSQDEIKVAVFGSSIPRTVTDPAQISRALNNKRFADGVLKGVFATPPASSISWDRFQAEIEADNPFIVGFWNGPGSAHVVVVYGARTDAYNRPISYYVWDPEPEQLGGGYKMVPLVVLNSHAWFYVIVRDAQIKGRSDDD